jgi:hypothetical protein
MQQRGELCFLILSCYLAHTIQCIGRALPGPGRVLLAVFPLASPLPSTTSATEVLFGGFADRGSADSGGRRNGGR